MAEPSLFVLPSPEEAEGALTLPEPPQLRHGATDSRARIKTRFWRPLEKPHRFERSYDFLRERRPLIDPARLEALESLLPGRHDVRVVEQPMATDTALRERAPQFILRNLARMEKDAWIDNLWWTRKVLRELQHELGLDEVRKMRFKSAVSFHQEWNLAAVRSWLDEHDQLFRRLPWSTLHFKGGRLATGPRKGEGPVVPPEQIPEPPD